jgi:hypothetical protein
MLLVKWVSSILFAVVVLAAEPPTELDIKTTHAPADCTVKAKKGDSIKVHYVCPSSCHPIIPKHLPDWNPFLQWEQIRLQVGPFHESTAFAELTLSRSLDRGQPLPLTRTLHILLPLIRHVMNSF